MATSDQITLIVRAEVNKAIAGLKKVDGALTKTSATQKKVAATTNTLSAAWKAIPLVAVITGLKKVFEVTEMQVQAENQLNTVLESTQHAAGLTSDEILNMASSLQKVTNFGDEAIINGQNLLLTFTKIGKDVFPQATETMLNMSTALGQDVKQSAIQVGKALQDPIMGVTNLRRVGIQLSDQQTAQIKKFMEVNDVASAQKIILGELETQFGGSARAAAQTGFGFAQLGNSLGDMAETLGKEMMPGIRDLINVFIELSAQEGDLIGFLKSVGKVLSGLGSTIAGTVKGFMALKTMVDVAIGDMGEKEGMEKITAQLDGMVDSFSNAGQSMKDAFLGEDPTEEFLENVDGTLEKVETNTIASTNRIAEVKRQATEKEIKAAQAARAKFDEMRRSDFENKMVKIQEEHAAIVEAKILNDEELLELDAITEQAKWEARIQIAQESMQKIQEITTQVTSTLQKGFELDQKLKEKSLNKEYQKRKARILATIKDEDEQKKAIAKLDAEFEKKKRKLKRETAKKEKAIAITNAVINTASAIVSALASPWPAAIAFAALAGALGAAQIAIIASTPIEAAEGGVIPGTMAGTLVRAGENAASEAILPLENEEAQAKIGEALGGGGANTINMNINNLYATEDVPENMAIAIDQALLNLKQGGGSAFAESIIEEQV